MRTCVRCGGEYESPTAPIRCPDCGARTLDGPALALWQAEKDQLTEESLVPVHRFDGPADKAILEEIFRDHGISYAIKDGSMDPLFGGVHLGNNWGLLLVPEEEESQALRLIEEYEASEPLDMPS
jgi:hypothetical protein